MSEENKCCAGGFGRRYEPDSRDKKYCLALILPEQTVKEYQFWNDDGWWGNQGSLPYCVGYAWTHWAADPPVTHSVLLDPAWVYKTAQKYDDTPGEDYEGTTVRGGAKVLQKERGLISNYYWAETVEDIIMTILELGPVTVGTNWYDSMMCPHADGTLDVTGSVSGGHAYVLNGVDLRTGYFRLKNSWGKEWGDHGHAYIKISDFARLLAEEGEACLATELSDSTPPIPCPSIPWYIKLWDWLKSIFQF
jgi:hypothetical protein